MAEDDKQKNILSSENKGTLPEDDSQINMLKKQLYARDESDVIKTRVTALGQPPKVSRQNAANLIKKPDLFNVMKARRSRRNKIIWWTAGVLIIAAVFGSAAALTAWYRGTRQVTQEQLGIAIEAPREFTAGETITYKISFTNNSRVHWKNVEIVFEPPPGWRFRESNPAAQASGHQYIFSTGDLAAGQTGEAQISGQLIGEANDSLLARAELQISPENFPKARINRSETFATTIVAVPVEISIEAAANAASGERMIASVKVKNTSSQKLEGLLLKLSPTLGLQLAPEDEQFSAEFSVLDSWWSLPALEPFAESERRLVMYIDGQAGERRTLTAEGMIREGNETFVLRQVNHVVTISASELSVTQTVNGTEDPQPVKAGQEMKAAVQYQNVGTTGLKNVIVTAQFEGAGLDASNLKLKSGAYNPVTKTITWTAASVPELAVLQPQQKGVLEYEYSILPTDKFPSDANGQNQSLIVTAAVDSPDLPAPIGQERKVASSRVVMPIATEPILEVAAFYDDGRLGLPSSGPLPPEVGQQTTYTLRFRFGSTFNDLGEAKMTAVLPDGVEYLNKNYMTAGGLDFNERNGEITWSLPTIEGLSGRAKPAPELHVQVGITPGENLKGRRVTLLQSARTGGIDMYIDQPVTYQVDQSLMPSTETASPQKGTVQ